MVHQCEHHKRKRDDCNRSVEKEQWNLGQRAMGCAAGPWWGAVAVIASADRPLSGDGADARGLCGTQGLGTKLGLSRDSDHRLGMGLPDFDGRTWLQSRILARDSNPGIRGALRGRP